MRSIFLVITLFLSITAFGQDTTWHEVQLDSIVSFQADCKMVARESAENNNLYGVDSKHRRLYAIGRSKESYLVTSINALDSFYKKAEGDIIMEMIKKNHFSYTMNDTSLSSIKGKHFHLTSNGQSAEMPFILIEYYAFLMNGHAYSFAICYRSMAPDDDKELSLFLSSLKFRSETITESKFR